MKCAVNIVVQGIKEYLWINRPIYVRTTSVGEKSTCMQTGNAFELVIFTHNQTSWDLVEVISHELWHVHQAIHCRTWFLKEADAFDPKRLGLFFRCPETDSKAKKAIEIAYDHVDSLISSGRLHKAKRWLEVEAYYMGFMASIYRPFGKYLDLFEEVMEMH